MIFLARILIIKNLTKGIFLKKWNFKFYQRLDKMRFKQQNMNDKEFDKREYV